MSPNNSRIFMFRNFVIAAMVIMLSAGCGRGSSSEKPPIHLNPNMDSQEKYKAQSESHYFADGSAMRKPVEGTVARGQLREDAAYFTGKDDQGKPMKKIPVELTMELLERGRERFDIYCSPCHSRVGDGQGIMVTRKYAAPPTFHQDRLRDIEDGYIFGVITNGFGNMPLYAHQVRVEDRWAIVSYLRALQRSRSATEKDIPADMRGKIEQAGK